MINLPDDFKNNMKTLLKDDYDKYIKSLNLSRVKGLRVNNLKISVNDFKNLFNNLNLEQVPWCDTGFYYNDSFKASKNFYYNAGLYYIQEPSAMAVGSLIDINEGDKVLDICAAPGGKTTHIASKLKNKGLIVSNDISASRCKALIKNIELMGVKNFCVLSENPKNLAKKFINFFDKIIVDAPCSGEGMFRKDSKLIKSWSLDNIKKYNIIQKEILYFASKMLSEGGILSYSTCTFNYTENEQTIYEFLKENKKFSLLTIDNKKYGISEGFSDNKDLKKCARILPYKNKAEGHFIALLKKDYEDEQYIDKIYKNKNYYKNNYNKISTNNKKLFKKEISIFNNFCKDNIYNYNIDDYNLIVHNNYLLNISDMLPNLDGLHIIRIGWHIGFIKNDRFEPSQSFAMGLKINEVKNIIILDENNKTRYLKGESFYIENANEGWNLVCLEKFPIGWAKVVNGRAKNKYPKSWMIN